MTERSSHKQILSSSAIIGGSSVINILISLLRVKVVAVLLGPSGVGLIGLLQNLMTTAAQVSGLGLNQAGTRQIAEAAGKEAPASIDSARRALFWGTLVLAIIGGCTVWILRHILADTLLNDPSQATSVGWLGIGVALTVATGSQSALLTGMRRIGDIARAQIISAVAATAIGIACIWWLGEWGVVLYILSGPLASFVVTHLFVARLPQTQSPGTSLSLLASQWKTMIRLGFAFMLAGVVVTLGQLAVRTLVQHELGASSLGFFQAAWTISMTYLGFVLGAMGTDYYPRLTASIHDHDKTNRLVNEQTEVALLLAGPVLLAMLALAPWIIRLLYTEEFGPAVNILRWQILGDILKIISWPMGFILLASGRGTVFMLKETTVIAVFVLATWYLLPLVGVESTGIAFLAMYAVNVPLLLILARHLTKLSWSKTVLRDICLLISIAVLTSAAGHWQDWLGAAVGLVAAMIFGLFALVRLARMAALGGPVGRLSQFIGRNMPKVLPHD